MFGGIKRYLQISCSLLCAVTLAVTGCSTPGEGADVPAGSTGNPAEGGKDGAETDAPAGSTGNSAENGKDNAETDAPAEPVLYGEPGQLAAYDPDRAHYGLKIQADEEVHEISGMLYGIFFEDINFAADGGLYAEMVQNRSFEFTSLAQGNEKHAWRDVGEIAANVVTDDPEGGIKL